MNALATPTSAVVCSQCSLSTERRQDGPDPTRRRGVSGIISAVSHELRSPLTVIRAYSSAALQQHRRLTRAELLDFVRLIDDSAKHVEMLVSDLQLFSQVQSAKLLVRPEPVCPVTLLSESMPNLRALAAGRQVTIEAPAWTGEVLADAGRVRQVLSNLVQNAARYSTPGGPILLRLEYSDEGAVISVEDTGPGVSEEHLGRIFEPFYRVAGKHPQGTGLGLAICAALLRAQNGRIWAENSRDGFKVSFSLPRSRRQALRLA